MPIVTTMNMKSVRNLVAKRNQNATDASQKQGIKRHKPNKDAKFDKLNRIENNKKRLKSGNSNPKSVTRNSVEVGIKYPKATETAGKPTKLKVNAKNVNTGLNKQKRLSKTKIRNTIKKSKSPNTSLGASKKIKKSKKTKAVQKSNRKVLMKFVAPFRGNVGRICDIMRANLESRDFCRV